MARPKPTKSKKPKQKSKRYNLTLTYLRRHHQDEHPDTAPQAIGIILGCRYRAAYKAADPNHALDPLTVGIRIRQRTLARQAGCSIRTVQRAIAAGTVPGFAHDPETRLWTPTDTTLAHGEGVVWVPASVFGRPHTLIVAYTAVSSWADKRGRTNIRRHFTRVIAERAGKSLSTAKRWVKALREADILDPRNRLATYWDGKRQPAPPKAANRTPARDKPTHGTPREHRGPTTGSYTRDDTQEEAQDVGPPKPYRLSEHPSSTWPLIRRIAAQHGTVVIEAA